MLNVIGVKKLILRKALKKVQHNAHEQAKLYNTALNLRWLNRVRQDHEARASDLTRKLIFSFFLLFS